MSREELLSDYMVFWCRHFPEYHQDRDDFLASISEATDGQMSKRADHNMVGYQDKVAAGYGVYEASHFQLATMDHILVQILGRLSQPVGHLVSLGSGPASYELWLLKHGFIEQVTLLDHSPAMLARARVIAEAIGLSDRVTTIVTDISQNQLATASADVVFSINAMHWSQKWRRWIHEARRIVKPGGLAFLSCSLEMPRSGIQVEQLAKEVTAGLVVKNHGLIMPPLPTGDGMAYISCRDHHHRYIGQANQKPILCPVEAAQKCRDSQRKKINRIGVVINDASPEVSKPKIITSEIGR